MEPLIAKPTITYREAKLSEWRQVGMIAADTYYDTPLTELLSPHRHAYRRDYENDFTHRVMARMLDPRGFCYVAVADGKVIAYTQLSRRGDSARTQAHIKRQKRWWTQPATLAWKAWGWLKLKVQGGDRSEDPVEMRKFEEDWKEIEKVHYENRKERWHVQSCVVRTEWQGKGIGKKLMGEAIRRAEEEGVPVSLEASGPGEFLYRSVGFELLARFNNLVYRDGTMAVDGGVMLYTPKGKKTI